MKRKKRDTGALRLEIERREELQSIVEAISGAMGLPASLWVLDDEKQALRIAAAIGVRPSYIKGAILPLDEPSVTGDCFTSGQPVDVLDVATDPRWKYKDEAKEMGWKSYLCVPVYVRDDVIGAASVYTFVRRAFTLAEQQLLTNYAKQVGYTIESERRRRALRRLLETTRVMERLSTEKPQAVLKQIAQGARDITGADCVVLYPYDPGREDFYEIDKVASSGLNHPLKLSDKPRRTGGMAAYVKEEKEVIVENIPEEHPDMLKSPLIAREGIEAFIGLALEVADSTLGILYINFRSPRRFQDGEKDIIRLFARQMTTAVHNARLFEQATNRATVLQRLHEIGGQLFSAELSERGLRRVLRQVARSARSVLGADLVDVYQYVEAEDRYILPPVMEGKRLDRTVVKDEIFKDDVIVRIIEGGEPLYTPNAQTDSMLSGPFTVERPDQPDKRFVIREGVLSSAGIPLKAAGETVGAMFVNYRTSQAFTPDQRETIELFANQAAMAIYNARVYEQVQARLKALEALNEVGQRLSTVEATRRGLSSSLRQVARQARKVLGADLVELYQYSPGREDTVATHVSVGKRLSQTKPTKVLPDDVVLKVSGRKEPLFAADAQTDPVLTGDFETEREGMPGQRFVLREKIVSTAAIPLLIGDESVGALLVNYRAPQRFQAEQQGLIQLFANQAAVAIRNAQFFQQRETLQRIARDITSVLDRDKLLQRTLERSLELLNCEFGSISVFDPETKTLQFRYAVGKSPDMSVKLGEGLIGTAAETRKPVRVADVLQDDRYVRHVQETRSELDVPMLVGKRLIGVLNAESRRPNAFSEADQHLAEALAAQAAVAFRTAELYEEVQGRLQERVDDIKALQSIYALIGTSSLEDVLGQIAEQAARLTPAKYTGIWLLDEQARELRFGARNMGEEEPTSSLLRLPLDDPSINARVALTEKTYLCNDVKRDPYYREWYADVRSELTTPLVHGGRVIGTLDLEGTEVGAFTGDHVRLVEALAGAAAIAIQSARLYDRLDTLARIGRTVTKTLKLDEVLDHILQEALKALGANYGTVRWLDRATDELKLRTHRGEIGDRTHESIRLGQGITGWVAQHGTPLLVGDVREDPRYLEFLAGTRCELAVPIRVEDTVVGVLNLEHPQPYAFDEHDMHLLEAIASQAATAVRNARLHEAMRTVDEVGRTLTSGIRLTEDEVLKLIHRQASKLMDTNNMYIALYDDLTDTVRFGLMMLEGTPVDMPPRKAGKGRTEEIVRTGEPILISTKAEAEAWYKPGRKDYLRDAEGEKVEMLASWVGVPMAVGEEVRGVIATYHPTRDYVYSSDDLEILQAMANQAAIALDNAHMFYDVNQRLEALVEFGQKITSGIHLSEDEVLKLIHAQATQLMDTDNMYIALYDKPTDTVRFGLAFVDGKRVHVETRKAGRGRTEEIIRTKKPFFHPTSQEGRKWYAEPEHEEYIGKPELASWLGVPMMVGEKVLGVIATYHPTQEYVYSGEDLSILQAIANQAATALENVRLLERKEKDIQTSRDIDKAIVYSMRDGPELQRTLELMLDKALERTGASCGNIMWHDTATGYLVMKAQRGVRKGEERARQKIGEGIVGLAAQDRETYRVGNVTEEPWDKIYIPFIDDVRSELATLILDGEDLLAVLNVEDSVVDAFDEEDARWLEDLAVRAVIAIRAVQAIEDLRQEQWKRLAAGRLAAVNAVAAGFVHKMTNVAGTTPVRVELIKELLDPSYPEYSKIMHYLDAINEDVDGILRTTKAIKSTATATEPLELVNVDILVSTAIQKIAQPPGIVIRNKCREDLPLVFAFSGQLVDTLENLIRNGVEAIETSGSVTIVGKTLVTENQQWVAIEVKDTGHGIPPTDLPRIFDLFFSTKPGGMGFALWRARTLVESLGGRIDASGKVGKGTTLTILLPVPKEVQR